jgi:hypothetical protein
MASVLLMHMSDKHIKIIHEIYLVASVCSPGGIIVSLHVMLL